MSLKVRLFLDGELIEPSQYSQVQIVSKTIDRIVNDVYTKSSEDQQLEKRERQSQDVA